MTNVLNRRDFLVAGAATAGSLLAERALARDNGAERARFIWYDSEGSGRNLYGLFRKTLDLQGPVKTASLHVFADSVYQLFVNGEFVEFGPVRFDPRFPLYDTHDIARRLKPGRNVIAIRVNHFGMKTYKAMPARAGLIAWGSITTGGGQDLDLATRAGEWLAAPCGAHQRYAQALSFALPPSDLYDQAGEATGWTEAGFDDSAWAGALELARQDTWGPQEPRNIPFMTGLPVPIPVRPVARPLEKREERHSFTVPAAFAREGEGERKRRFLLFSTWIFSPEERTVTASVFYGDHWLNGAAVPKSYAPPDRSLLHHQRWRLNKGWNHLCGKVANYHDRWDQYFGLPAGQGLLVSADRDESSRFSFRHSRVLTAEEVDGKKFPLAPEDALIELGGWTVVARNETAHSPNIETSWDEYGDPIEELTPESLAEGHVFTLRDYPNGFALLVDLDSMHLFFPRLRLEGARGAAVDLVYSERLSPDQAHVQQFSWYPLGDRILCARDSIDWVPIQPRGTRYLLIAVRNTSSDVRLRLTLRSANYPVDAKGAFRCPDAALTNIWQMCARTQAANMEDVFVDCAGRERGMYGRDTVIQFHNALACFGESRLMNRCMELFGQSADESGRYRIVYPNSGGYTYAPFSLNMVEGYRAYYEYTGDLERIRKDWKSIETNLRWFDRVSDQRPDLLLDAGDGRGFEADPEVAKGLIDSTGVNCFYSCSYLIALRDALVLARAIGESAAAARLEKRIGTLSASIPKTFWNPERQCFSDNLARKAHSIHSNLFAVRAGAVSPPQLEGVRKHIARELRSVYVNGYDASAGYKVSTSTAFFILDGLYKAGLVETAENLMRQGWSLFLSRGAKTCPEFFSMEHSLCHAWSAAPAYYLPKYALGVRYKAPNLDEVEIAPQTHGLEAAEGAWPHPRGVIEVKWHLEDGRRVFDYVRGPKGVRLITC